MDQKYYLLNTSTSKLSLSRSGDLVSVSYYSVFDSSTHETDSFDATFSRTQIYSQLVNFSDEGKLAVENSAGDQVEFLGSPSRMLVSFSSKNPRKSFSISGMELNLNEIIEFLK